MAKEPTPAKPPRAAQGKKADGPRPIAMEFDLDSVTIGEMAEVEDLLGGDVFELMGTGKPKMRMLQALAFVKMRKANPDLTFEDVGDLSFEELSDALGEPPSGEGSGAAA